MMSLCPYCLDTLRSKYQGSKVIGVFLVRIGAFVGENAKGAHGAVYKFHTSVMSAHFFDQE